MLEATLLNCLHSTLSVVSARHVACANFHRLSDSWEVCEEATLRTSSPGDEAAPRFPQWSDSSCMAKQGLRTLPHALRRRPVTKPAGLATVPFEIRN